MALMPAADCSTGSGASGHGERSLGNRSQAKQTARLRGSAVALDCGTYICVAGPMATAQGRLRVLTGNHRSAHSYCDDPAHAAKTDPSVTLFKRALTHQRKGVLSIFAARHSPQLDAQQHAGLSRRPPPTAKAVFPAISRTEYDPVHNVPRIGCVGLLCGRPIPSGQTTGFMDNGPRA